VSDQHEDESLRRWAREQAQIERQTDALVLKTITAMVQAADDLKSRLRRDTDAILEGLRREKRALDNDISLATAERLRLRREAERERDAIVSAAQAQAREIVSGAERDREAILAEVRAMEQRLRGLEEQIRAAFGLDITATPSAHPEALQSAPADQAASYVPTPVVLQQSGGRTSEARPRPTDDSSVPAAPDLDEIEDLVVPPSSAMQPPPTPPPSAAPGASAAPARAFEDGDEDVEQPAVAPPVSPPTASATPPPLAPSPNAPAPSATTPPRPITPPPQPGPPAATNPPPRPEAESPPQPARRRHVELVFTGVPGYQQATALEQAVNDFLPDGDADIVEFEQGKLVLSAQATDLESLARQLVAAWPASLTVAAVAGDRATFRCV
jgi:hypothetical protein